MRDENIVRQEYDELHKKLKELEKEKEEIRKEKIKIKSKKNADKLEILKQNKDIILSLTKHSRTSCDDNNTFNGWGSAYNNGYRCAKCALIELLNDEYCGNTIPEVELNIDFRYPEYNY